MAIHEYYQWADPTNIPYMFLEVDQLAEGAVETVRTAMDEWQRLTCVRFVETPGADVEYAGRQHMVIRPAEKVCTCSTGAKRPSTLRIAEYCAKDVWSLVHELGHCMGLAHEHNRPDRDQYVRVFTENMKDSYLNALRHNPEKIFDHYATPYSVDSVMHYKMESGAKSYYKWVLCPYNPLDEYRMQKLRKRGALAFNDIAIINSVYCRVSCFPQASLPSLDFRGNWTKTRSSVSCQRWDVDVPHVISNETRSSLGDVHHNHCRNPDNSANGPWCYTASPKKERDGCFIPCEYQTKPYCEGFCHNGGYWPDSLCSACRCPPGYHGRFCEEIDNVNKPWYLPCGGIVTEEFTSIQPSFPWPYNEDEFCIWWIKAPSSSQRIQLSLTHYDLPADCSRTSPAKLWIRLNGVCADDNEGQRICPEEPLATNPLTWLSNASEVVVKFVAKSNEQKFTGFVMNFHFVNASDTA